MMKLKKTTWEYLDKEPIYQQVKKAVISSSRRNLENLR